MEPLISIIVPIYNSEKYIKECIESIINQTYSNIEIILLNDGSTDRSLEICNIYSQKDKRINVINKKNTGVSDTRNIGIKYSNGQYIMFIDSDDWIDLDTCEIAIKNAIKNDSDIVMWTYVKEFKDKSIPKIIFDKDKYFDNDGCRNLHRRLFGLINEELRKPENADALCTAAIKLYKSSIIKENNIKFEDIKNIGTYEDGLFNINIFKYVKRATFINKTLYHYRKTNQYSITTKYKFNMVNQWLFLFNLLEEYIEKNSLENEFKNALNNRIAMAILVLGLNICESNENIVWKISEIKRVLNIDRIREAYKKVNFKYYPISWKVLLICCKYNFSIIVYILLNIIKRLKGRV